MVRWPLIALLASGAVLAEERPEVGHREDPVARPTLTVDRADQARSPRAVVSRSGVRSVQVNVDGFQQNIVGDAANEPSMAIDPTDPNNIVIGWRQFGSITSNFREAGMAYSLDGGETWNFPGPLQPGQFRSDPVLAATSDGDYYYYSLSSVTTAEYFISEDKGVSWIGPISSPGGDKNWHTIDASGGIGDGHVYALWNSQFTCCAAGTDFTRSTDAAASFGGPYVLPVKPKWGTDAVGPDGELYVVGSQLNTNAGHLILRSDDADDALETPSFPLTRSIDLGGTTDSGGVPNPGGLLGQVWVDVDRSNGPNRGNVYVLGSVDPPGGDPLDVHLIRSVDGGQSWSSPLRVNDDPIGGAFQWFATMSVAPDGRIDVVWNDTRNGNSTLSELYYAYSTDAGLSFSSGIAVSPLFDSTVGHPQQNKIGDYYQMVSLAERAGLAWSATFNGEQDVYFTWLGDCNGNGVHDGNDLANATSEDLDANGIPDECQPDCNDNGIPDAGDLLAATSADCNGNGLPDECDITAGTSIDCNGNALLDDCEVLFDLESDEGFIVGAAGDGATAGIWVRVDPVGTTAAPENDRTPAPGAMAFVTGQGFVGGAVGAADVEGGRTTLISPSIDLAGLSDPWIGYWRWYYNRAGAGPGPERFTIDISPDGGTGWVNVERLTPSTPDISGGWRYHRFAVADIVTPTDDMRLRFIASDLLSSSIIEAAIDDISVLDCAACAVPAPGEATNLRLDRSGDTAELDWSLVNGSANYSIYRGSATDASDLSCLESGIVPTEANDDGTLPAPGELQTFVVSASTCGGEGTLGSGRVAQSVCP